MTINNNSAGKPQALTSAEISKIVETEGAQAANSSNLDDLELVPGDLEVGDCQSDAEVIENLHELDVAAEELVMFPSAATSEKFKKVNRKLPRGMLRGAEFMRDASVLSLLSTSPEVSKTSVTHTPQTKT